MDTKLKKSSLSKHLLYIISLLLFAIEGFSNNVQLSSLNIQDSSIQVNLQWENYWSDSINHDAVWLFAKYKENDEWMSLPLLDQSIHTHGVMYTHDNTTDSISLHLKYNRSLEDLEVKLYAIEMVYIPEEAFWMGDGASNESLNPRLIDSLDAFYAMKYEITQEQYCDYLNCLSRTDQEDRTNGTWTKVGDYALPSYSNNHRNEIKISQIPSDIDPVVFEINTGKERACNWIDGDDLQAYLDWAHLSTMNEYQYEKACRGPEDYVVQEFAWGTNEIMDANTLINDGLENERVSETVSENQGLGVHGYDGPQGPLRVGFAANDTSNRLSSGASYYGIFELSGNLWEIVTNKDGDLAYKGGAWNSGILENFRDLAVSDRYYIDLAPTQKRNTNGGRGVIAVKTGDSLNTMNSNGRFKGGSSDGYACISNKHQELNASVINQALSNLDIQYLGNSIWKINNNQKSTNLILFDLYGRKCQSWELSPFASIKIDLNHYASGIYLLSNGRESIKLYE